MKLEEEIKMLSVYPACSLKEEDGCSVIFPDLNYLATCGETLKEALIVTVDCLARYLYMSEMGRDVVPPLSEMGAVSLSGICRELGVENGEGFVNLAAVNVSEYAKNHLGRSVKKTLTIPAWLSTAALKKNTNFSQTLQGALKEKLAIGEADGHYGKRL